MKLVAGGYGLGSTSGAKSSPTAASSTSSSLAISTWRVATSTLISESSVATVRHITTTEGAGAAETLLLLDMDVGSKDVNGTRTVCGTERCRVFKINKGTALEMLVLERYTIEREYQTLSLLTSKTFKLPYLVKASFKALSLMASVMPFT
jgi:hypothetical protein